MKINLLSYGLVLTLLAVGCQTHRSEPADQSALTEPGHFNLAWNADLPLGRDQIDSLYVRGKDLFVYTQQHGSFVLSATGGSIVTSTPAKGTKISLFPPVVLKDQIIYPTNTTLEFYNFNGRLERTLNLNASIRNGAVGEGEMLYVGVDAENGGRLLAFNVTRSSDMPVWEILAPNQSLISVPAINNGVVYYGTSTGNVRAVSVDRNLVWPLVEGTFKTAGAVVADIKADDAGVYVASSDTELYAIERLTGRVQWIYFAGLPLKQSPIVTKSVIYQPLGRAGIAAIDRFNGSYSRKPLWVASDAVQFLSSDKQYAYLLERGNRIVARDAKTGQIAFESKPLDFSIYATNEGDTSLIYAARPDGVIQAIEPSSLGR